MVYRYFLAQFAMYITDIKVDGHLKYDQVDIFKAYPSLKPHILFYSNSLAIWHGFRDITYIKVHNGHKAIFSGQSWYTFGCILMV